MANKYFFCAALLAAMLAGNPVQAQSPAQPQHHGEDEAEAKFFGDWSGVIKLLNTRGIDAGAVDWSTIDPICLPFQNAADMTQFYRCKFKKAIELRRYNIDHDTCRRRAEALNPDRLLTQMSIRTYTVNDPNGGTRTMQEYAQPITQQELNALRDTEFDSCMHTFRWLNSNDWKAGMIPAREAVVAVPAAVAPAVVPAQAVPVQPVQPYPPVAYPPTGYPDATTPAQPVPVQPAPSYPPSGYPDTTNSSPPAQVNP